MFLKIYIVYCSGTGPSSTLEGAVGYQAPQEPPGVCVKSGKISYDGAGATRAWQQAHRVRRSPSCSECGRREDRVVVGLKSRSRCVRQQGIS